MMSSSGQKLGSPAARGTIFWKQPQIGRRMFFRHFATAVGGYFLLPSRSWERTAAAAPPLVGTAKNCILITLSGAASHVDTFDLKVGPWTPASFRPTSYPGIGLFPQGLMPQIATQLPRIAIVRTVRSWALLHPLAFGWSLIARNPSTEAAAIAPHIGSVVARELSNAPNDQVPMGSGRHVLPAFVSLNADDTSYGSGYFPSHLGPFNIFSLSGDGLDDATHGEYTQDQFSRRYSLIADLELGKSTGQRNEELAGFRRQARQLMFNADIDAAFKFSREEHSRYGSTAFGDSCLVARNLLRSDLGVRFIHVTSGAGGRWDQHFGIYQDPRNGLAPLAKELDNGLGTLLADLQANSLLDQTLVVWLGEFGRTTGPLNEGAGRDHHLQQFACFAGGGVKGGRSIGSTSQSGEDIREFGWSGNEPVRFEHIASTIYSALGIDYTKKLTDDPIGRGFEYVPASSDGAYPALNDLFR
jgi:hypothetical protein